MTSTGVPPGVPSIDLSHVACALRIYRRRKISAPTWTILGVCLCSPALITAISVALLIVCAWSLMQHIQYVKPPYKLSVLGRLLVHGGMTFAAINAALLVVELVVGTGHGAWSDVDN